jgi:hypothetical protein
MAIVMTQSLSPRTTFEISRLIASHGSFARPFLQWTLASEMETSWKAYFRGLQRSWHRQDRRALREIETGLAQCSHNRTLRYMLLAEKLLLLERLGRGAAQSLYQQLRNEFERMPPRAREIVRSSLVNYRALLEPGEEVPVTRLWSKAPSRDRSALAFLFLGQARERSRSGKLDEATSLYLTSLHYSLPIPHPTGILAALNDLAWYSRKQAPSFALALAEQAAYLVGEYFEDLPHSAFVLDTLFELQAAAEDPKLLQTVEVFVTFQHMSAQVARRYAERLVLCKRLLPDYRCSRYPNEPNLQRALRLGMASVSEASRRSGVERARLSQILNGRVGEVRGDTLRRLIKGLALIPGPLKSPLPLLVEWSKTVTQERFGQVLISLGQRSPRERVVRLLGTYMAYFQRRRTLPWLARKGSLPRFLSLALRDLPQLAREAETRWESRSFLSFVEGGLHPLLASRQVLASAFLTKMPEQQLGRFAGFYADLAEEDRQALDEFARNYTRYDRPWGLRIPCPEDLKAVTQALNLREEITALAWFAIPGRGGQVRLRRLLLTLPVR